LHIIIIKSIADDLCKIQLMQRSVAHLVRFASAPKNCPNISLGETTAAPQNTLDILFCDEISQNKDLVDFERHGFSAACMLAQGSA
jgi:hypothetical protein